MKKNNHKKNGKEKKGFSLNLPQKTKRQIGGILFFLLAVIFALSFFGQAGFFYFGIGEIEGFKVRI